MNEYIERFESNYARLVALRDLCTDPRVTLYVIAYLTAASQPEHLDAAIAAARAFVELEREDGPSENPPRLHAAD